MRNLAGKQFGDWTVICFSERRNDRGKSYRWLCKCACGMIAEVEQGNLKSGASKGCQGCAGLRMRNLLRVGQKFGRWTVLGAAGVSPTEGSMSKVKCACGNIRTVGNRSLRRGRSTGCRRCRAYEPRIRVGQSFGEMRVIGLERDSQGKWRYKCLDSSGQLRKIRSEVLKIEAKSNTELITSIKEKLCRRTCERETKILFRRMRRLIANGRARDTTTFLRRFAMTLPLEGSAIQAR